MGIRCAVKSLLTSSSLKKLEFLECFSRWWENGVIDVIDLKKCKCFPEKMSLHLSKGISHIVWPSAAHSWYCLFWEVMINSRLLIRALCMSPYRVLSALQCFSSQYYPMLFFLYLVVMTGPCTLQKKTIHMGHLCSWARYPLMQTEEEDNAEVKVKEGFCLWPPFFPLWWRQTSWIPNSQSTETCLGAATSAPSCWS